MIESKIVSVILYVVGGSIALFLAYVNGKRTERLRQMKEEAIKNAKEQEIKNEVDNNVANMPISDVRDRLSNIKSK